MWSLIYTKDRIGWTAYHLIMQIDTLGTAAIDDDLQGITPEGDYI